MNSTSEHDQFHKPLEVGDLVHHLQHFSQGEVWLVTALTYVGNPVHEDDVTAIGFGPNNWGQTLREYAYDVVHASWQLTDEEKRMFQLLWK